MIIKKVNQIIDELNSCYLEDKFTNYQYLGHGAYGIIYRVQSESGAIYALKAYPIARANEVTNEFSLVRSLNKQYSNFIRYEKLIVGIDFIYLLMEYLSGYTLDNLFSESDLMFYLPSLVKQVKLLHENRIYHRDIKPLNIIYSKVDDKITLFDFQFSLDFTQPNQFKPDLPRSGTPAYFAPEISHSKIINEPMLASADVWALGITCLKILFPYLNLPQGTPRQLHRYYCKMITKISNPILKKFISEALIYDWESRSSINSLDKILNLSLTN